MVKENDAFPSDSEYPLVLQVWEQRVYLPNTSISFHMLYSIVASERVVRAGASCVVYLFPYISYFFK
jgi:hypothetical protein